MCLAAAYKNEEVPESLVCKFVSNINIDGDTIVLTDIMGEEIKLEGTVSSVDLVKNIVVISTPA